MSIRFNVRLFNSGRQLALRDTDNRQGSVSDSFIISGPQLSEREKCETIGCHIWTERLNKLFLHWKN